LEGEVSGEADRDRGVTEPFQELVVPSGISGKYISKIFQKYFKNILIHCAQFSSSKVSIILVNNFDSLPY